MTANEPTPTPNVVRRGRLSVLEYYVSLHPRADRNKAWDVIAIDDVPYGPLAGTDGFASLGPSEAVPAASIFIGHGPMRGQYLLSFHDGEPVLDRISVTTEALTGRWVAGGRAYVLDGTVWDLAAHRSIVLPAYTGTLFTMDPELESVLSFERSDATITFHQTWLDGRTAATPMPAARAAWLFDSAHALAGTSEPTDGWMSRYLAWACTPGKGCSWSLR